MQSTVNATTATGSQGRQVHANSNGDPSNASSLVTSRVYGALSLRADQKLQRLRRGQEVLQEVLRGKRAAGLSR